MTVYAITDTKKGRTGIAPTYLLQTTHKRGFTYIVTFLIIAPYKYSYLLTYCVLEDFTQSN